MTRVETGDRGRIAYRTARRGLRLLIFAVLCLFAASGIWILPAGGGWIVLKVALATFGALFVIETGIEFDLMEPCCR